MQFITHNQNSNLLDKTRGTGYLCDLKCTYKDIVNMFGLPVLVNSYDKKISCKWIIEWNNEELNTIYDYKESVDYLGVERGKHRTEIVDWHIGGNSGKGANRICQLIYADKTAEELLVLIQGGL